MRYDLLGKATARYSGKRMDEGDSQIISFMLVVNKMVERNHDDYGSYVIGIALYHIKRHMSAMEAEYGSKYEATRGDDEEGI